MCILRAFFVAIAFLTLSGTAFSQDATKCADFADELATTPAPPIMTAGVRNAKAVLADIPSDPQIVLVGDSLFMNWNKTLAMDIPDKKVWNFSVGGDRTQQALWRLDQIDVAGQDPDAVVIFIGTNNLVDGGMDACGVLTGIKSVIKKSRELWINSTIFVVTISPRGGDFLQYDKDRLIVNKGIENIGKDLPNVYPILLSDKEITAGQYGKPALTANTLACFPDQAYRSPNYMTDNLHFTEPAYKVLRKAMSDASLRNLGKDVFDN